MSESEVSRDIRLAEEAALIKQPWLPLYQALAQLFLTRSADFTHTAAPGAFIHQETFDNTAQFAAHMFASVSLSMLWPDSSRTFNIVPKPQLKDHPGVEAYFRAVTARQQGFMDEPEAGLSLALMAHFLDDGVFGIAGLGTFEKDDADLPVVYESWDVKSMCVSENAQGFVDRVYLTINRTVRQVYEEYGTGKPGDKISAHVAEQYKKGKYDEIVEVLKVIEPKTPEKGKKGVAAMAYRAAHIDKTNRLRMRRGGYEEMPVAVGRLFKRAGETQGRSCGMIALPDGLTLSGLVESVIIATEKQLDPPLVLLDDGRLGGAVVNTGAGEMTVINTTGRLGGEKPLDALFTVGEMQSSEKLMEKVEGKLMQAFFLDRLLDLNNKTVMTAYETSVRNRLRGESTGSIFARRIMEVLIPTIRRTFNILYRKGYFGDFPGVKGHGVELRAKWRELTGTDEMVVPDIIQKAVAAGLEIYDIEFISPAMRFIRAEKLQGLFSAQDSIAALVPIYPTMVHRVDSDKLVDDIYTLNGAPKGSLRPMDETLQVRAAEAERQNAATALAAGKDLAQIQRDSAQAKSTMGMMGGGK